MIKIRTLDNEFEIERKYLMKCQYFVDILSEFNEHMSFDDKFSPVIPDCLNLLQNKLCYVDKVNLIFEFFDYVDLKDKVLWLKIITILVNSQLLIDPQIFINNFQKCLFDCPLDVMKLAAEYMIKINLPLPISVVRYCIIFTLDTFYSRFNTKKDIHDIIDDILNYKPRYYKHTNQNELIKRYRLDRFLPRIRQIAQEFRYKKVDILHMIIIIFEHVIPGDYMATLMNEIDDPYVSLLLMLTNPAKLAKEMKLSYSNEARYLLDNGVELFDSEYYKDQINTIMETLIKNTPINSLEDLNQIEELRIINRNNEDDDGHFRQISNEISIIINDQIELSSINLGRMSCICSDDLRYKEITSINISNLSGQYQWINLENFLSQKYNVIFPPETDFLIDVPAQNLPFRKYDYTYVLVYQFNFADNSHGYIFIISRLKPLDYLFY